MFESALARTRHRVGLGLSVLVVSWLMWMLTPGMPVRHAPHAEAAVRQAGLVLFEHEWTPGDAMARGDGLGPVFNDRSCVACHSQGGVGGGGDARHNVAAFEAHPVEGRPDVQGGVIHSFATSKECRENIKGLHQFFPIVPGGLKLVGSCFVETRDFDPVKVQTVNPTALFGAGWIDQISDRSILQQGRQRSWEAIGRELLAGDLNAMKPGRARVLPDGRIGKFGWKAQFATLEEFVAAACANELGLGNPLMEQARPWARTAVAKVDPDLDATQFRALVSFVNTLPRPVEMLPDDPQRRTQAERGRALFGQIGCALCHTPQLGGVEGVYSDFLLHRVIDPNSREGGYTEQPNVPLPSDHPSPEEWKTPPLWGVADSAPYFHDGASPTLEAAIIRHKGDASSVSRAFELLPELDRAAIVSFLKTLKAPSEARPANPRSSAYIAMAR
ncbi:MAG TPA: di-heme oxidoredictase family protein [Isosphaeraceae bacterium]|nr:di-heme oxidoredictase family protein [Isosphaeraceae bacterium]